jgi:hypothetical protein
MPDSILTESQILAIATETLESSGYSRISEELVAWPAAEHRLFEDAYGIVALTLFGSWSDLVNQWTEAQASLAELISAHLTSAEPKAWEGYLVLLTRAIIGPEDRARENAVRYDTSRVRKLVATGDDLTSEADVKRVLLPLIPLRFDATPAEPILDLLPALLYKTKNIPETTTKILLDAFRKQEPLVEALHSQRKKE